MEPLIALLVVPLLVLGVAGAVDRRRLREPSMAELALRAGVTTMFVMTGLAHFVGMREELVAMVPPALPAPELLVTVTGILELLGAAGLWVRRTRLAAAAALTVLLVALFPANVHLALTGESLPWYDELLPRTLIQVVFLAAAGGLAWLNRPGPLRRRVAPAPEPVARRSR